MEQQVGTVLISLVGIYKFYAVDILTLQDKPGFPVLIDGSFADNDPTRYVHWTQ
jgi:hypothetical protein